MLAESVNINLDHEPLWNLGNDVHTVGSCYHEMPSLNFSNIIYEQALIDVSANSNFVIYRGCISNQNSFPL